MQRWWLWTTQRGLAVQSPRCRHGAKSPGWGLWCTRSPPWCHITGVEAAGPGHAGLRCQGQGSAVPRDARVLETVALAWRPDMCGEGICHRHEHNSHCKRGPGTHCGRGPGITTGMEVASAMSMSVASAMSTASSRGHKHGTATSATAMETTPSTGTDAATITTHGITASSLDGLLPSQLGPEGTPQPPTLKSDHLIAAEEGNFNPHPSQRLS